ncbi:MAG: transcription termination/antitermination factor NusG, partial [Nonlabens ulvanivorans]
MAVDSNEVMHWYVVRSVSGQENKIKDYIESEIAHH